MSNYIYVYILRHLLAKVQRIQLLKNKRFEFMKTRQVGRRLSESEGVEWI